MINFNQSTDAQIEKFLLDQGFIEVRKMQDGEWVGLLRLAFTMSVCCGIEEIAPFKYRWCFESEAEARIFYASVEEYDAIPEQRTTLRGYRYIDTPRIVEYNEQGLPKW